MPAKLKTRQIKSNTLSYKLVFAILERIQELYLVQQYNLVRQSMVECETLRREFEPQVIEICEKKHHYLGGGHTVFSLNSGVLQLRYKKGIVHENTSEGDLQSIDEDIKTEIERLTTTNQEKITAIEATIKTLQEQLQDLKSSERLIELLIERDNLVKKVTKDIPIIAFKIS